MLDILSPRLQRILRDWESWRRGREFPSRADFTPFDLAYILGNVSLVDVAHDPLRFRYRLHASNVAQRIGKELTSKSIDEIPVPHHALHARKHFSEVVERRVPVVYRRGGSDSDFPNANLPADSEVLVLPLSSDGTDIDMLVCAMVWDMK